MIIEEKDKDCIAKYFGSSNIIYLGKFFGESLYIESSSEKKAESIRQYISGRKDPRKTFIGGAVIGGAIGFAVGILAVSVYVHIAFLSNI